jgi:hypothetical protein
MHRLLKKSNASLSKLALRPFLGRVTRLGNPPMILSKRTLSTETEVGYITDIEGCIDYWYQYVDKSSVLYRGRDGRLQLGDGCQFVFGGDALDRGILCVSMMSVFFLCRFKYYFYHLHRDLFICLVSYLVIIYNVSVLAFLRCLFV